MDRYFYLSGRGDIKRYSYIVYSDNGGPTKDQHLPPFACMRSLEDLPHVSYIFKGSPSSSFAPHYEGTPSIKRNFSS